MRDSRVSIQALHSELKKTANAAFSKFTQHHPEWCRIGRCCKEIWGSQTASRLLARLSDTDNVRNQPLSTKSHNGKPTSLLRLVISDVATKSCCPMLCRRQVPLQMDYNWLMISHAHIRVTRQMISWPKQQWSNAMAIKKFRFSTNYASALMKDRINRKVTHRHMLVDLRRMAVEELQNLPQCPITDLFGTWAHVYSNVFSTMVVNRF